MYNRIAGLDEVEREELLFALSGELLLFHPFLSRLPRRSVSTLYGGDFIRLHNQDFTHAGIIVCTVDPDFAEQARRIDEALQSVLVCTAS